MIVMSRIIAAHIKEIDHINTFNKMHDNSSFKVSFRIAYTRIKLSSYDNTEYDERQVAHIFQPLRASLDQVVFAACDSRVPP